MIKANELRLGNYVNGSMVVKGVSFEGCDLSDMYNTEDMASDIFTSKIEPIPLTEDWLLKFWFWVDEDSHTFKIDNCTLQLDFYDSDEGFMAVIFGDDLKMLKHVHQLQNLYFALTNEELTLKD